MKVERSLGVKSAYIAVMASPQINDTVNGAEAASLAASTFDPVAD